MKPARTIPVSIPTLTEVVELTPQDTLAAPTQSSSSALELVARASSIGTQAPGQVMASATDSAELTRRVLSSLQCQVDDVIDQRLKDALVPILARCAESMMLALREDLASTLHELVSEAVEGALTKNPPN